MIRGQSMMVAELGEKTYTIAEYLQLEEQTEVRHEFINGEIMPMVGGTTNHNIVVGNIYITLRIALKGKNIPVYMENVRLSIPKHNIFTYPDVMVMAGETIYDGESKTTVNNPAVIIEVLSDSTRDYDLGRKFSYYRSLDTLQEYVLIEPEQTLIMIYRRDNNKHWSLDILDDATDRLRFNSLAIEMSLPDIYESL